MPKGFRSDGTKLGFQKGYKQRPEHSQKISLAKNGVPMSEAAKKKLSSTRKSRKFTPWNKSKKGLQVAWNKGREFNAGSKHPRWKGGGKNWVRLIALRRDDYKCSKCRLRDPEIMEVDHIKPKCDFPELSKDIDNLETLCPNCHRRKTNRMLKSRSKNAKSKLQAARS